MSRYQKDLLSYQGIIEKIETNNGTIDNEALAEIKIVEQFFYEEETDLMKVDKITVEQAEVTKDVIDTIDEVCDGTERILSMHFILPEIHFFLIISFISFQQAKRMEQQLQEQSKLQVNIWKYFKNLTRCICISEISSSTASIESSTEKLVGEEINTSIEQDSTTAGSDVVNDGPFEDTDTANMNDVANNTIAEDFSKMIGFPLINESL